MDTSKGRKRGANETKTKKKPSVAELKQKAKEFFEEDSLPGDFPVDTELIKSLDFNELYHASGEHDDDNSIPLDKMSADQIDYMDKKTAELASFFAKKGTVLTFDDAKNSGRYNIPYSIPKEHSHQFLISKKDIFKFFFSEKKGKDIDDIALNLITDKRAIITLEESHEYRNIEIFYQKLISKSNLYEQKVVVNLVDRLKELTKNHLKPIVIFTKIDSTEKTLKLVVQLSITKSNAFFVCEALKCSFASIANLPKIVRDSKENESRILIKNLALIEEELKVLHVEFVNFCYLFCDCSMITGKKE
jgi:hypothetical protein